MTVRPKILFTPSAREQFLGAIEFIARENPSAARQLRKRGEKALDRLRSFPGSDRVIPEFPDLPFREVIVPPYRFFYRLSERTVWVVAVWHSAQLPDEPET